MKINYNNRKFRPISNSENGEVTSEMIFHYKQQGDILTCSYRGEKIIQGHLLGIVSALGSIDMRYHQVSKDGQMMTGVCCSTPEVLENGKIRLIEEWKWTFPDQSSGMSILEEL